MNEMTEGHTVKRYDGELSRLHALVLETGNLACEQVKRAVKTLEDEDPVAARKVIERDQEVNDLDLQIDEEVVRLIVKRQPVAKDLRQIIAIAKITSELERVGDQACKIAESTIHCHDNQAGRIHYQIIRDIVCMADYACEMLRGGLDSFDRLELGLAVEVMRKDQELEEEFRTSVRRLSTLMMEDVRNIGQVVDIVLGVQAAQRIGGHARNIAGHVVFLITGRDVRHRSLAALESELGVTGGS